MMKPLGDRVLISQEAPQERRGLIVIPSKYRHTPQEGVVLAIGDQVQTVKVGDRVLYGRFAVLRVEPYGLMIRERDLMAILE